MELIKIFISHSDDTADECKIAKSIISEESKNHIEKRNYELEGICWDDIPRGIGDPQEDLIDPIIINECEILIIILWKSFGNPTKKYESGIEHEYEIAKKHKKDCLIFFSNKLVSPLFTDTRELERVQNFKKKVETERFYGHCGCFSDKEDFLTIFRGKLADSIYKILSKGNIKYDFNNLSRGF